MENKHEFLYNNIKLMNMDQSVQVYQKCMLASEYYKQKFDNINNNIIHNIIDNDFTKVLSWYYDLYPYRDNDTWNEFCSLFLDCITQREVEFEDQMKE